MESTQHYAPYVIDPSTLNIVEMFETCKAYLSQNLETILIGTPTSVQWPTVLKNKVAETILLGQFKYFDDTDPRRLLRVAHLEVLTTGTSTVVAPLHTDPALEKNTACLCDAVLAALDGMHKLGAFKASEDRVEELRTSFVMPWLQYNPADQYHYNPADQLSLGAIADVVRDVMFQSASTPQERIDILFTSIMGIPCVLPERYLNIFFDAQGQYNEKVSVFMRVIAHTIVQSISDTAGSFYARPVLRWNRALGYKLMYLLKIIEQEGSLRMNWSIIETLSRLDHAQTVIETGVAIKPAGMKLCIIGPVSLLHEILSAIADVYDSAEAAQQTTRREVLSSDAIAQLTCLLVDDLKVMQESKNRNEFGKWTSIIRGRFTRETLRKFTDREGYDDRRVATNQRGDVMFFVRGFGPWKKPKDYVLDYPDMAICALLEGTVQGYNPPQKPRTVGFFRSKKTAILPVVSNAEEDTSSEEVSEQSFTFQPCNYKPSTLNAIINRPNRILVRRKGIRGNWGRGVVAGLIALGIVVTSLNFANRDNFLERIYDGAQAMSLISAVIVAVLYIVTKTLQDTLDWLRGVTEVHDEDQLAAALSASLDDVKAATAYETGTLHWLSDQNSSFCPGTKSGDLVFTNALASTVDNPHVRDSLVVENERGLWLFQGWAFKLEGSKSSLSMVKVPYEDTVYVVDKQKRFFR